MQNIIFDLGGVLVNYDLEADTEALLQVGLPLYSQWSQYPQLSSIANNYLNGLTTSEEFCRQIRPYCHPGVTDAEIEWSMIAVMGDLPKSRLDTICRLRERYHVYLLSNINQPTWQYCVQQFRKAGYEPEDCFDCIFLSYEMQLAKPDIAIFRQVIDTCGLDPHQTIFLDDNLDNIEASRQLGIDGWLVPMNESEALLQQLINCK